MSKLLRFEFHKLFRQKSFYICTALLLVINLYTISYAYDNGGRSTGLICMSAAVCSTDFTMLFGIFTALFTCDDYANGTIRNILSRGFTRTQVYFAQLITVIVAAVIAVLLVWAATFTAGTLCWRDGLNDFNSTVLSTLEAQLLLSRFVLCDKLRDRQNGRFRCGLPAYRPDSRSRHRYLHNAV